MPLPTVFISYSHEDEPWKDLLLPHFEHLERKGDLEVWDDRRIRTGDDWYARLKEVIARSQFAVCLISAHYLSSSFCMDEEIPYLLQRRRKGGLEILPVLLRSCVWEAHPWLRKLQMLPRDGKTLAGHFADRPDEVFAELARHVYQAVQGEAPPPATRRAPGKPPERIQIDRLPETGSLLFGRRRELSELDDAWNDPGVRVVVFKAWGGAGKSTLVRRWCEEMAEDNYRGAEKVYGWSFYSQGSGERVTSAELFLTSALEWFGDRETREASPWEKANRLANLICSRRTLLLLDGIEPLQSGDRFDQGAIRDPGLRTLLLKLARDMNGLCMITTRQPLTDLKTADLAASVLHLDLEQVSTPAGRALLRVQGVRGPDADLEKLVEDFGNHALAVHLLAVWIVKIGEPAAPAIPKPERPQDGEGQVRRILKAFEERLGDSAEIELLKVLSLFDGPADRKAVLAVLSQPPIAGLTSRLCELGAHALRPVVERLRDLKLMSPESRHRPEILDTHPLVREYFAAHLRQNAPAAWREGNSRLYEHLKQNTREAPQTIDQLAFLVAAAIHGCRAGRYRETLEEVYWERIRRENRSRNFRKFGAFGTDLVVMAGFFEELWDRPVAELTLAEQGFIFNNVGFCLRSLGRLQEALRPLEEALRCRIAQEDWFHAAADAESLSEACLALGQIDQARDYARQGVRLAEQSEDVFQRILLLTTLADALHQAGEVEEARALFREAELMQRKRLPEYAFLYSVQGYQFCELLLEEGKFWEVEDRADQILQLATGGRWRLDRSPLQIAVGARWLFERSLGFLAYGKASLLESERARSDLRYADMHIQWAVEGLRLSDYQNYLPGGLLARAALHLASDALEDAEQDLTEAMSIAKRGSMKLHETDCHLGYARLHIAAGKPEAAREHLAQARRIIAQTGYRRREPELRRLEKTL